MATLHFFMSRELESDYIGISGRRVLHHCLLNGIGNIYVHNYITYMDEKRMKERMRRLPVRTQNDQKLRRTFWRQLIFNGIFVLENTVVVGCVLQNNDLSDRVPGALLGLIPLGQLIGLIFHFIYYQFYHLWKDLLYMHIDVKKDLHA